MARIIISLTINRDGEFGSIFFTSMKLAFGGSAYVSVRDENSKQVLARFVDDRRVQVIPDSAFGVARVLDEHSLAECTRLRSEIGLSKPYIVLQANRDVGPFMGFVRRQAKLFEPYQLLMLAPAPVNGDTRFTLPYSNA